MGKSRLVHEFTRHQLRPGWLVLEGASVSYGKATPYFPLIEMLRRYFQITDRDGQRENPRASGDAYFGTGQHAQRYDPANPFITRRVAGRKAFAAIRRARLAITTSRCGRHGQTIQRDGPATAASSYLRCGKAGAYP